MTAYVPGTLAQSGADYTLTGVGDGIGGTSDQWIAGRASITGDCTIIAKVSGVTGTTTASAFAGLSFRGLDDPGSKAVHLLLSSTGVSALYRSIAGSTATTVGTTATFDYYIGPTGLSTNDGLTTSTPWDIFSLNSKRATYSGKTVGLLDGTYSLYAKLNDGSHTTVDIWALDVDGGTSGAPTVIKAVNARAAILTGKSGTAYGNATQLPNAATPMLGHSGTTPHKGYVTFDGLKITGCARMGIRVGIYDSGTAPNIAGITVKNCEFTDFDARTVTEAGLNYAALEFNQCNGHLVQNNYFHDSIGTAVGSSDHFSASIQWNSNNGIYEYNTSEAGSLYAKELGQFGNTLRYNYIDSTSINDGNVSDGGIVDFSAYSGSSATTTSIHHNILIAGHGIDMRDVLSDAAYCHDLLQVYNNTIIALNAAATRGMIVKATAGQGSVYNNIVQDSGTGDDCAVAYNLDIDGICDYNCYYSSASNLNLSTYANAAGTVRTTVTTIAAFRTATGAEAHSIVTNPLFVGTGVRAAQYVLQAGSPAKSGGKTTGLVGGFTCDMGAWGNSPPVRIGCDFAP